MREQSFVGVGEFYLARAGEPLRSVGNVSAASLEPQEETRELQDYTRPGGGLANSLSRITAVNVSMTLRDFDPRNLALVLAGAYTEVAAGTVTEEPVTVASGSELIVLDHTDLSAVVVTDQSAVTTYADYEVSAAGIRPTEGGDLATAIAGAAEPGLALAISYDYGLQAVIEALTRSGDEYRVVFDGLNDAQSGAPVVINLWRMKFSPTSSLSLITESNFAELPVTGRLLADRSRGAGESAYAQVRQKVLA